MAELIEQSQKAMDELIVVVGRPTIEAVLKLSAQGVRLPHRHLRFVPVTTY
jgi:hypothetical protein